jgi:hypothetical protein
MYIPLASHLFGVEANASVVLDGLLCQAGGFLASRPGGFFYCALLSSEKYFSTHKQELLAIVECFHY